MSKRTAPPIHTADDVAIEVGMTVYGIDVCDENNLVINPLKVIDVDLGPRRTVRLRKKNGIEWTWSANSSRTACRNGSHLIYATRLAINKKLYEVESVAAVAKYKSLQDEIENAVYRSQQYKNTSETNLKNSKLHAKKSADLKRQAAAMLKKFPNIAAAIKKSSQDE